MHYSGKKNVKHIRFYNLQHFYFHFRKMAASGFSLEAVKNFMIENDCKVTNHELVTNFKSYLNDPDEKGLCIFTVDQPGLCTHHCK